MQTLGADVLLFFGNFIFGGGFDGFGVSKFSLEFLDAALSIDKSHFTGEKRMTGRTNIHGNGFFSRTGHERVATGTGDDAVVEPSGMNVCFHRGVLYQVNTRFSIIR